MTAINDLGGSLLTNVLEGCVRPDGVVLTPRAVSVARKVWRQYRVSNGYGISATDLLTPPKNQPKTRKNAVPTYVLHLAPSTMSGFNTCAFATVGCASACLNTAGRGRFDGVQRGRLAKTMFLADKPEAFLQLLWGEIRRAVKRHNGKALFRLNGTSDLRWERFAPFLFELEGAEFYDYTKYPRRDGRPDNYQLAYSANERNSDAQLLERLASFGHVAVVVDTPAPRGGGVKVPLPTRYLGTAAHDGDETDDWRDRDGFTLLRAKGDAVGDTSGFVRPTVA